MYIREVAGQESNPELSCSVVDPHHVDADPDSTYHPYADPDADPGYQSNIMRIRIHNTAVSQHFVRAC